MRACVCVNVVLGKDTDILWISDENSLETSRVLISETVFKEAKVEFVHIFSS